MVASYFKYWGKAKKDSEQEGADYHLLPYHCLDVAAVGALLLAPKKKLTKDLAEFLGMSPEDVKNLIVFLLVFHDLGKFTSAFQGLYSADDGILISPVFGRKLKSYDGHHYRHDRMGLYFWHDITANCLWQVFNTEHLGKEKGRAEDGLMILMECMLGHHGEPIDPNECKSIRRFTEPENLEAAQLFFTDVYELLKPSLPIEKLQSDSWRKRLEQVSWQIAGIAVLADWVGSDQSHFKYHSGPMLLGKYWVMAQKTAIAALNATDLNAVPTVSPYKSIKEYYGYNPTPLQQWAEDVAIDDSPQLFILEDVTGSGKTEAAMALTHRLMEAGAAEGFYFGLPTMATSNAMFDRVSKHYQQMLSLADGRQPSIVLAHGAREMNDVFREAVLAAENPDSQYDAIDPTATAQCNQWLADSRKKALLAPVGVGTIDQALLAVLPRRHQSLRLLGLNQKVLVVDEVHASDDYMFELLESLLSFHLHQGGSVVLLTATLSQKQRKRLVSCWHKAGDVSPVALKNTDFPLATKVSLNQNSLLSEVSLENRKDVSREIAVVFLHDEESCINKVLEAVERDECVVWIRNSVNDALEAYQLIQQRMENPDNCLLFHSRFILQDRKNIEKKVLEVFGKSGDASIRAGKVLISTQVFQESLDADATVMISDICPIDDLIQRVGRLHRHTRDKNQKYQQGIKDFRPSPTLWLHCPQWSDDPGVSWLSENFKNTQYVYRSPGRLWLGMRELKKLGAIRMPAEARQLIESVYGEEAEQQIPEALKNQENALIGEERCKASAAKSSILKWDQYGYSARSARGWHDDNTDISTRHSDIETVEVLLLRLDSTGSLVPWVDGRQFSVQLSTVKLSKNKYADKLVSIDESVEEVFKRKYRQAKYLQCWLPELDPDYGYSPSVGFCELIPA